MSWYYGIEKAYPRLRLIFGTKLPALIQNCRPYTLLAPMVGGFGIMLGAGLYVNNFPFADMALAALVLAVLNAAGNQVNSIYDKEIDEVNKPYRPLVRGVLTEDTVHSVAVVMYVASALLSAFVNPAFMGFMSILFIFSIYYSAPPVRAKKRFWFNNCWQAASRGLFGTVAAWSVVASPFNPIPWAFGAVTGVWMLSAQTAKDFPDIEGDKKHGVQTLPVVYGKAKAKRWMGRIMVVAFLLLTTFALTGVLPETFWYFMVLGIPSGIIVPTVDTEMTTMENSVGWVLMYLTLTVFYVGFPLALYFA